MNLKSIFYLNLVITYALAATAVTGQAQITKSPQFKIGDTAGSGTLTITARNKDGVPLFDPRDNTIAIKVAGLNDVKKQFNLYKILCDTINTRGNAIHNMFPMFYVKFSVNDPHTHKDTQIISNPTFLFEPNNWFEYLHPGMGADGQTRSDCYYQTKSQTYTAKFELAPQGDEAVVTIPVNSVDSADGNLIVSAETKMQVCIRYGTDTKYYTYHIHNMDDLAGRERCIENTESNDPDGYGYTHIYSENFKINGLTTNDLYKWNIDEKDWFINPNKKSIATPLLPLGANEIAPSCPETGSSALEISLENAMGAMNKYAKKLKSEQPHLKDVLMYKNPYIMLAYNNGKNLFAAKMKFVYEYTLQDLFFTEATDIYDLSLWGSISGVETGVDQIKNFNIGGTIGLGMKEIWRADVSEFPLGLSVHILPTRYSKLDEAFRIVDEENVTICRQY